MMMKSKLILTLACATTLTACQLISPIFVDYNGVRRDVAEWINQQPMLSMQQKRSLAQLSKAQQKLVHIDQIPENKKFEIAKENSIAMHCAYAHVSDKKITALQKQIFGDEQSKILNLYNQQFPKIKLDTQSIHCE